MVVGKPTGGEQQERGEDESHLFLLHPRYTASIDLAPTHPEPR